MTTRFDECLKFVAKWEGGFSNDPVDRGGPTNMGITQATLDRYLEKKRAPSFPVENLKADDARVIYFDEYWVPAGCSRFIQPLDLITFDTSVNMGVRASVKLLQRSLGIKDDGVLGPITLGAVSHWVAKDELQDLCLKYWGLRKERYDEIVAKDSSQKKFARGWHNRMLALLNEMDKLW